MTCGKCRYSHIEDAGGHGILLCRRWPPQMTAFTKIYGETVGTGSEAERMQSYFNFPVVNFDWTCGEYAGKEAGK